MLRSAALSLSFIVAGLLSACGPIYKTEYAYVPPKTAVGGVCISQCIQSQSMCEQMCQMKNDTCRSSARQDAYFRFKAYQNERRQAGLPINKTVSDFDSGSFGCSMSCDCKPAFNACYSACGGEVLERQTCVAFCDKK